jgi:hypothetical protein
MAPQDGHSVDMPTPLLERRGLDQQHVHLSFGTVCRCRLLVVVSAIEAAAAMVLACGAYHWDSAQLWSDDVSRCSALRSIVDIAAVAGARCLLFLVLLARSARVLQPAARALAVGCALSCVLSLVKLVAIVRAPSGEPCVNDPAKPRNEPFALALVVVTLGVCLANCASCVDSQAWSSGTSK